MTARFRPFASGGPIGTRTCAIDVDGLRAKIIDAHQMRIKGRCKRRPPMVITEQNQDHCESIIAQLMGSHWLARQMAQGRVPLVYPRLDMDEARIPRERIERSQNVTARPQPRPGQWLWLGKWVSSSAANPIRSIWANNHGRSSTRSVIIPGLLLHPPELNAICD
jgi:hypothetical protein